MDGTQPAGQDALVLWFPQDQDWPNIFRGTVLLHRLTRGFERDVT